ncbi:glycosyltransferase family 2 protein, partial [Ligilactobacillus agilis]
MQVSVCIITRDESQKLARCLESLKNLQGLVAEVLVLDTGSSDDSIQVAERLGAKVYQQAWRGDFAWARNYLVSQAKCDLVLFLDTDEWVAGVDIPALEALLGQVDLRQTVGRIVRLNLNQTSQTQSLEPRLYLKSYFNFSGKIHEQVNRQDGGPVYYQDIPLVIKHDGYASQELLLAKAQRNLDLLLAELAKQPNDPYLLFQVGKSYYSQKNLELARKYFEASL